MRRVVLVAICAAVVATPVSAADVAPGRLVLRQADVPAGLKLDRANSGVRSNAVEAEGYPDLKALIARSRITGYEVGFDPTGAGIGVGSRADIFRTPKGASAFLDWFDDLMRRELGNQLDRRRVDIGDKGWIWRGPAGAAGVFTFVAWRHGRIFAAVATGLSRERTLALARAQQRRIVTALR